MKDYLATMVEQSVEYPLQTYSVHRIPVTSDSSQAVFVVAVDDSPAAPHQAKDERQYYYRIDGHSKPAPHFHVELLRNRMTKSVLSIQSVEYDVTVHKNDRESFELQIELRPTILNISMQSTNAWGVLLKRSGSPDRWLTLDSDQLLSAGACVNFSDSHLLPHESRQLRIDVVTFIEPAGHSEPQHYFECLSVYQDFFVDIYPISHNSVGQPFHFMWDNQQHGWQHAKIKLEKAFAAI